MGKKKEKKEIRSVCLDEMMQISAHCQKKATIDTRNKPLKPKDTVEAHELHPIFPQVWDQAGQLFPTLWRVFTDRIFPFLAPSDM